jgi:hypothetical protein
MKATSTNSYTFLTEGVKNTRDACFSNILQYYRHY